MVFGLFGNVKKSYDVITVGSGTVDAFVMTDSEIVKKKVRNETEKLMAYQLGSKILIEDLQFFVGGGGTNTAVAFARLGLKTGWLGKTGSCENSSRILKEVKEEKIDFLGTRGKGMAGYSVILDSILHDRTVLAYKGENDALKFREINKRRLDTGWFYFSSMVGESFKTQKLLAKFAKQKGIKLVFNPSSYQAKLGKTKLKPILDAANLIVLNDEEAAYIVGHHDVETTLKELRKLGPEIAIVTMGKNGAYCSDGEFVYIVYPQKVKVKETTGAGDAFASTFLASHIRTGGDIVTSLKIALVNAQSVIQYYGPKNILLSWPEAIKRQKQHPVKVTSKRIA